MAARYFTPDEANELLAEVRPVAERLVAHRREMAAMAARRARYVQRIAGNGGDFDPGEARADEEGFEREGAAGAGRGAPPGEAGGLVEEGGPGPGGLPAPQARGGGLRFLGGGG